MSIALRVEVHPAKALEIILPLRLVSEANQREHWAAKARRAKQHRQLTVALLRSALRKVPDMVPPVVVTLTRIIGPRGRAFDDDNLRSAFKAIRDGIAQALGADDGDKAKLRFEYAPEERGKDWGARVRIEVMP